MNSFDLYIHGAPEGHDVWGSDVNRDYISTFYSRQTTSNDKVFLQIDILDGDSYYTYIHRDEVFDVNGRAGSFFAITLRFEQSYTTNTHILYQLFEAVYNKFVLNNIIKVSNNEEVYIVRNFASAITGNTPTINILQTIFNQKIDELLSPYIEPLKFGDTFSNPKKIVSLLEVDSPLFFDYFKKYSIIVSPNMQPTAIAFDTVSKELKQATAQKKALSSSNEQLQSEVVALTQENKSLSNQLQASTSSTEKKYKGKIDQLQSDLIKVITERDTLKQKIQDATSSIELIDQPFQKLSRLLADRFPETHSGTIKDSLESNKKNPPKGQAASWRKMINSILLVLVFVCCCVNLLFILRLKPAQDNNFSDYLTEVPEIDTTIPEYANEYEYTNQVAENSEAGYAPNQNYDSWDECFLNIQNGGDKLEIGKDYSLSITKNGIEANVPQGDWAVYVNEGELINTGNTFKITDASYKGSNLRISYIVNGVSQKTRVCTIM